MSIIHYSQLLYREIANSDEQLMQILMFALFILFPEELSDESNAESEEDPRAEWPRRYAHNVLPDESSELFRGRPFSYEVIDNMWHNFSVASYAPVVQTNLKDDTPSKKEWAPSITIPEPFQMTLREAAKSKVKSRRKEKLEQEILRRKLEVESELNKQFKARPIPATTFAGLYKENEAKQEEKREYRRELSKAILEATQKPFDFTKREEMKKEQRRSASFQGINMLGKSDSSFKARPFPTDLFNLSLEDKRAEQDEYRKIKMNMRSQEMLASSNLPPNMRARGQRYAIKNRSENSKKMSPSKTHSFKPMISHDIPDFKEMQEKFQVDLIRKKKQRAPTVCQPFNLHTAKIPIKRSTVFNSWNDEMPAERSRGLISSAEGYKRSTKDGLRRSSSNLRTASTPDQVPPFA